MIAIKVEWRHRTKAYDVEITNIAFLYGIAKNTWYFDNEEQALGRLIRNPEVMPAKQRETVIAFLIEECHNPIGSH